MGFVYAGNEKKKERKIEERIRISKWVETNCNFIAMKKNEMEKCVKRRRMEDRGRGRNIYSAFYIERKKKKWMKTAIMLRDTFLRLNFEPRLEGRNPIRLQLILILNFMWSSSPFKTQFVMWECVFFFILVATANKRCRHTPDIFFSSLRTFLSPYEFNVSFISKVIIYLHSLRIQNEKKNTNLLHWHKIHSIYT